MPNEFCVSTLRQILGPERFSALQAEIPLLHRAVAEVAQERRRQQGRREEGSPERRAPQRTGTLVRCQVLEGKDGQELKPFQT